MKKIIMDKLKARFEGVSESILDRVAAKLASTVKNEEEATTAVEGVTLQQLFESYGDSRATEAQATAVRNYEKKYGLKDGAKVSGDGPDSGKDRPDQQDDDTPAWAKSIMNSVKALSDDVTAMKGERIVKSRKTQLDEIVNRLPEYLRKPYEHISLAGMSDEEFESLKDAVKGEVESTVAATRQSGAVFGKPPVRQKAADEGKEASEKEVEAVVDRLGV